MPRGPVAVTLRYLPTASVTRYAATGSVLPYRNVLPSTGPGVPLATADQPVGTVTAFGVPWYFTTSVTGFSATTGVATTSFSFVTDPVTAASSTVTASTVSPAKSRLSCGASRVGRMRRVAVPVS